MTQAYLEAALAVQGERLGGEADAALLTEATTAYCLSLRVSTEAADPVGWAMTMETLGLAQEALAATGAVDACETLREAARSFEAALRVFDPEHMPYNHGKATASLARVRANLARDCA